MLNQGIKIDHVGWVTNDIEKFESFWVDILGFKNIWESRLSPELSKILFGLEYGAICRRYQKGDDVIEIHKFDKQIEEKKSHFNQYGINHIALYVENRKELIKSISNYVDNIGKKAIIHIYHNPSGWDNIFVQDFESNWIELRETLNLKPYQR